RQRARPGWRQYADERARTGRRRRPRDPARPARRPRGARRRGGLPRQRRRRVHDRRRTRRRRGVPRAMNTAIVTGAGSGMGRATAQRFLREGWTVIGLDITPTDLDGGLSAVVDVRDRAAVNAALAELVPGAGGSVHAVANVAGIYQPTTLSTYTEELYRRVFD